VNAVERAIARASELPLSFPTAHRDIRRAVVGRFPYAIYFRLVDDDVIVLAHHAQPSRPATLAVSPDGIVTFAQAELRQPGSQLQEQGCVFLRGNQQRCRGKKLTGACTV
jgi:hypothetical protein